MCCVRQLLVISLLSACAPPAQPLNVPPSARGPVTCEFRGADTDRDGLSDSCETHLAEMFAPLLRTAATACNVHATADARRLGGGYLYAVTPVDSGVRLMYLPAYFQDCGWSGAKCRIPFMSCAPHAGDSEFIAIDVATRDSVRYDVTGVFLSAHCFDGSDPGCRWYRGPALQAFAWAGATSASAPVIWVADGKGANYPSRRACDAGKWRYDTCDAARVDYRYPIDPERNIGSRTVPRCYTAALVDPSGSHTMTGAAECPWDTSQRFRGWQGSTHPGATPYERYLREVYRLED